MSVQITFTQQFQDNCLHTFNLRPPLVKNAVRNPDEQFLKQFDDMTLGIFLKREVKNDYFLLILARQTNNIWEISSGFRLRSEVYSNDAKQVLTDFVKRFGCNLKINSNLQAKFFFDERINLEPNQGNISFSISRNERVGYIESHLKTVQGKDGKITCYIALLFAIDTYAYVKWLFDWKDIEVDFSNWLPEKSPILEIPKLKLDISELENILEVTKRMFPDNLEGQKEGAKLQGAYLILEKAFGTDFCDKVIAPSAPDNFLSRNLESYDDRATSTILLVQLAEALYTLHDVPGFTHKLEDMKSNYSHGEGLESLWFELIAPYIIRTDGNNIECFIGESRTEKRPDVLVNFRSQLLPLEIKAKLETTSFNNRAVNFPLNSACQQLPQTGPGIVFLLVPFEWANIVENISRIDHIAKKKLNDNRNCNAIFIWFQVRHHSQNEKYAISWHFRSHFSSHAKYPVPKLRELVKVSEVNSILLKSSHEITYLPPHFL